MVVFAALGFISAGFSEVLAPLFGAVLLLSWYTTRNKRFLATLGGFALGTAVVFLAPGNSIRAQALPPRMPITLALQQSIQAAALFIAGTATQQPLAFALAFLLGYVSPLQTRIRRRLRWALVSTLGAFAVMSYTVFAVYWTSSGLAERHFTFATALMVAWLFVLGMLCAA